MKTKWKKIMALLMTMTMLLGMSSVPVYADENGESQTDSEEITTFGLDDTKSMEVVEVDVGNVTDDDKCTVYDNRIVFMDDTVIYELTGTTDKYLAF